jgi:hypothetical protein
MEHNDQVAGRTAFTRVTIADAAAMTGRTQWGIERDLDVQQLAVHGSVAGAAARLLSVPVLVVLAADRLGASQQRVLESFLPAVSAVLPGDLEAALERLAPRSVLAPRGVQASARVEQLGKEAASFGFDCHTLALAEDLEGAI